MQKTISIATKICLVSGRSPWLLSQIPFKAKRFVWAPEKARCMETSVRCKPSTFLFFQLALIQTNFVVDSLKKKFPDSKFEISEFVLRHSGFISFSLD
jgi:hypothetical protein